MLAFPRCCACRGLQLHPSPQYQYYPGVWPPQAYAYPYKEVTQKPSEHDLLVHKDVQVPVVESGSLEAETDNDDYDIELTPEMVEFLRRSADRRRQKKQVAKKHEQKQREKHTKKVVSEWVPYQQTAQKHMSALSELYGPAGASRIQQLETALNTNYDTHRDTRASVMWPSMPLRL